MAWIDTAIVILREVIGDSQTPLEYSDSRLEEILYAAAYITNYEGVFGYTVDVEDKTLDVTPANDFISLTIFKAVAMVACGEARISSKSAISIKDGPSSIDTRGIATIKQTLCDKFSNRYEGAMSAKLASDASSYYAIVGPFNYDGTNYGSRSYIDPRS